MSDNREITPDELERGCKAFEKYEGLDSMYRVATFLLEQWWGRPAEMVDALTVLLLTWNSAFYRYGMFDQSQLDACLREHWLIINGFRAREITSFGETDHAAVRKLFRALLEALQMSSGKGRGRKSPVAVVKTLHLLATKVFPLWDDAIAREYACYYARDPEGAYLRFCGVIRDLAVALAPVAGQSTKSLVKRIDEFNYARYTKKWI